MTTNGWIQILVFLGLLLAVTKPLGVYMSNVFERRRTILDPVLRPVERTIYRIAGVDETREMRWTEYAGALIGFSFVSIAGVYAVLRLQYWFPLNPQQLPGVASDLAFNTAASFVTNTNWQSYAGESTMSYFSQMVALTVQNFVSGAVGIALAIAFVRGIARKESETIGNFWVDTTRATLWVLLPICLAGALFFVSQGVVQNLRPYDTATLVEPESIAANPDDPDSQGKTLETQTIAQGPVASQEAIKLLGTNGGGFFNANSAHPFENPTPLANLFSMLAILAIASGLTCTLGRMTGSPRHGWAVWAAMLALFAVGLTAMYWAESSGNPLLGGTDQAASAFQSGGNMEGKEVRFGTTASSIFGVTTTAASCGAVNGMHGSMTPIGGLVALANMMLGEVVFGGVGAGLYGMLLFVVLTVFIAGLMVGRTPEYMGKKIEAFDVKMAMLAILVSPLAILVFSAVAVLSDDFGTSSLLNHGPHGLTEILYAYTSSAGNNGSAFAGLSANTPWYNTTLGVTMLLGRFFLIVPMLALAGNLAGKKAVPASAGTFPVTTPLFTTLLASVVVIVGALTFFPALGLGPIVEHLLMLAGETF
ncbi:MAG: potassium-transporting ATPase subunit KdpA [Acidobacteria bacterium]|nr:potassium-transporting ATPase subunit KdpA [Acidobacteriota bacterium]